MEKKIILPMVILLITTIIVAGANWYVERNNITINLFAGIQEKEVTVSFFPKDITLEPEKEVLIAPILISTSQTKKPGYMELWITYDATALTYVGTEEPDTSSVLESLFVIEEPNDTGTIRSIHVAYGLKDKSITPQTTIELPLMKFRGIKLATSSISIDSSQSQVTFLDQDNAELVVKPATVTFSLSPTPTVTPTVIPPTSTQEPTPTPSNAPTSSPIPTETPTTPTNTPNLTPIPTQS